VTTAACETSVERGRRNLTGGAVDEDRSAIVVADADIDARVTADPGERSPLEKVTVSTVGADWPRMLLTNAGIADD
jgi:hypothetical protein